MDLTVFLALIAGTALLAYAIRFWLVRDTAAMFDALFQKGDLLAVSYYKGQDSDGFPVRQLNFELADGAVYRVRKNVSATRTAGSLLPVLCARRSFGCLVSASKRLRRGIPQRYLRFDANMFS